MPCRSYDDDFVTRPDPAIERKLDMLSRIACKALTHIEESNDGLEILILKDPEIQEWWSAHKEADRKAQHKAAMRRLADERKAEVIRRKNEIKAKLSPEELKILGVR